MITVIDYGMGNLGSILNMLKKIGVPAVAESDPAKVAVAGKVILPGVGAFDNAMKILDGSGLSGAIKSAASGGSQILGICLGMQLLGSSSEEGTLLGLNLIPGKIKRFKGNTAHKVPHMGWSSVAFANGFHLSEGLSDNRFYFVHSYYYQPDDEAHAVGKTNYGHDFTSVVKRENVVGAQFHPEKSHRFGMQFLTNFSKS